MRQLCAALNIYSYISTDGEIKNRTDRFGWINVGMCKIVSRHQIQTKSRGCVYFDFGWNNNLTRAFLCSHLLLFVAFSRISIFSVEHCAVGMSSILVGVEKRVRVHLINCERHNCSDTCRLIIELVILCMHFWVFYGDVCAHRHCHLYEIVHFSAEISIARQWIMSKYKSGPTKLHRNAVQWSCTLSAIYTLFDAVVNYLLQQQKIARMFTTHHKHAIQQGTCECH